MMSSSGARWEQGFKMKISSIMSIDFLTQIDVLTNNVQNMFTSHKYTKLVHSCINPNVQRCFPHLQNLTLTLSLPGPNPTEYYKK